MSSSLPLIRASALIPSEMWLLANGRPAAELFSAAALPPFPSQAPNRLMSLHAMYVFLEQISQAEGPDFAARISTPLALLQLGAPAQAVLSSGTVREALLRASWTFHQHASHVFFLAQERDGGLEVTSTIPIGGTPAMHHMGQQHTATLVLAMGTMAVGRPLRAKVWISPHPLAGIAHLRPYLGDDIIAAEGRQLRMWIEDEELDLPLRRDDAGATAPGCESLGSAAVSSLVESARILVAGMVADGNPGMDRLALCAGRSRRTLQRLLATEGTSYAELLNSVRQDMALASLSISDGSIGAIAGEIGFRSPSSLTRAVRRWTNTSPRQLRGMQQAK